MAKNNSRLGRGLNVLLKDPQNDIRSITDKNADKVVGQVLELDINSIETNPNQPRTSFSEESLQELANSISQLGVIQPITVRKIEFNKYQLVSGERRFRASKLLGLQTIPAYIRIANDEESLMMALVENIQREDLDPIEIALSYQRMLTEINLTQEQMSERVGKNRSTISNYLRLLNLDPIIQTGMRDGFISMAHGKEILYVDTAEEQMEVYNQIIARNLSVRETKILVKEIKENKTKKPHKIASILRQEPDFVKDNLELFRYRFNSKVNIRISKTNGGKGKIEIPFNSEEDFQRIKKLLQGE